MSKLVDVVILNWNGLDVLRPCLDSLAEQVVGRNEVNVICWDNGSEEPGFDGLSLDYPWCQFHKSPINHGYAKGNNYAAAMGSSKYLIFLNNDTLVDKGWLSALIDCAEGKPEAAIVGSMILNADRTIQNLGAYFDPSVGTYVGAYRGYSEDYSGAQSPKECEVYIACSILVRRDFFESVGGFDEGYFQGYEDYDLCLKAREAGLKIFSCPDSKVIHFAETSTKRLSIKTRRKAKKNNARRFFQKWEEDISRYRLPFSVPSEMTPLNYYNKTRRDILEFFPYKVDKLLEIGCGGGVLSSDLKKKGLANLAWGVEPDPRAAELAAARVDRIFTGKIEDVIDDIKDQRFDAVVLADVIEHTLNPWLTMDYVNQLLNDDGVVVMSIPNLRHYKVIKKIIKDKWLYEKEGILDKTHLRFFGLETIKSMLNYSGFEITKLDRKKRARGWIYKVARKWDKLQDLLTYQYLIVARKKR